MPLATYSDLQASIAATLDRTDLSAQIPDFIAMGEASLSRDLRHHRMIARATAAIDARHTQLPADWLETLHLRIDMAAQGYRALTLLPPDQMERERARVHDAAGVPRFFAHVGDEIEVFPTPNDSFTGELTYYARIPALADGSPTNWLLTLAPDAYLYASLIHSAPFLHEDARVAIWGNLYAGAVAALARASDAARLSGPLRLRMPR